MTTTAASTGAITTVRNRNARSSAFFGSLAGMSVLATAFFLLLAPRMPERPSYLLMRVKVPDSRHLALRCDA